MTPILIIACTITLVSGAILIGADYEQERPHTKKPRRTVNGTRPTTRRINTKGFNALRKRTRKNSTLQTNKTNPAQKAIT